MQPDRLWKCLCGLQTLGFVRLLVLLKWSLGRILMRNNFRENSKSFLSSWVHDIFLVTSTEVEYICKIVFPSARPELLNFIWELHMCLFYRGTQSACRHSQLLVFPRNTVWATGRLQQLWGRQSSAAYASCQWIFTQRHWWYWLFHCHIASCFSLPGWV